MTKQPIYYRFLLLLVKKLLSNFDVFGGMSGQNFCTVFMLLFIVLWVHVFVMLCMMAVRKLMCHSSLFPGLGLGGGGFLLVLSFLLALVVSAAFSLKEFDKYNDKARRILTRKRSGGHQAKRKRGIKT
jgi:hypothetical protein